MKDDRGIFNEVRTLVMQPRNLEGETSRIALIQIKSD